jgi:hypothetical protein
MTERCPSWAKETWRKYKIGLKYQCSIKEHIDLKIKGELLNAQLGCLAKWLELDKIYWYDDIPYYPYYHGKKKLRFFKELKL